VKGATVVELTEDTYPWVKPLLAHGFTRDYVGRDRRARFGLSEWTTRAQLDAMPQFYGEIIVSLIQRGTLLSEVGLLKARRRDLKICTLNKSWEKTFT